MIINNTNAIATGAVQDARAFTIKQTPEMMELLSRKLYSNPTLAVSRELLANAYDATIATGEPYRAIDVTLPTTLEPTFIVRDYGSGLSEEDIYTLYTTYGASTKRGSNTVIGGFGVGSKSPFALTDSFTVKSFYGGKVATYHCFRDAGLPKVTKLFEDITEEHTGLEVFVPISNNNLGAFLSSFEDTIRGYNKDEVSLHNLQGEEYLFFEDLFRKVNVDNVYFWSGRQIHYPHHYALVKMGKVIYNCPFFSSCFLLDAPIGTFKIAASREYIEDCEENKKVWEDTIAAFDFDEWLTKVGNIKTLSKNFSHRKEARILFQKDLRGFKITDSMSRAFSAVSRRLLNRIKNKVYIIQQPEDCDTRTFYINIKKWIKVFCKDDDVYEVYCCNKTAYAYRAFENVYTNRHILYYSQICKDLEELKPTSLRSKKVLAKRRKLENKASVFKSNKLLECYSAVCKGEGRFEDVEYYLETYKGRRVDSFFSCTEKEIAAALKAKVFLVPRTLLKCLPSTAVDASTLITPELIKKIKFKDEQVKYKSIVDTFHSKMTYIRSKGGVTKLLAYPCYIGDLESYFEYDNFRKGLSSIRQTCLLQEGISKRYAFLRGASYEVLEAVSDVIIKDFNNFIKEKADDKSLHRIRKYYGDICR